jgi:hypothetical protein
MATNSTGVRIGLGRCTPAWLRPAICARSPVAPGPRQIQLGSEPDWRKPAPESETINFRRGLGPRNGLDPCMAARRSQWFW